MSKSPPKTRPAVDTASFKVAMSGESRPLLEALAALGIYGKTPSEVIRRLAEQGLEKVVFQDKVLQTAGYDVAELLKKGRKS